MIRKRIGRTIRSSEEANSAERESRGDTLGENTSKRESKFVQSTEEIGQES